jgi:hypothetical protein
MNEQKVAVVAAKLTDEQIAKLRKASAWVAIISWTLGVLMAVWTTSPLTLYKDFTNAGVLNPWMLPSAAICMAIVAGFWFLVVQFWLSKEPAGSLKELKRRIFQTVFWVGFAGVLFFVFIALASMGFLGILSYGLFGFLLVTPMNLFPLFGFSMAAKLARIE